MSTTYQDNGIEEFVVKLTREQFFDLYPRRTNKFWKLDENNRIVSLSVQNIDRVIICDGCNRDLSNEDDIFLLMSPDLSAYGTRCLPCVKRYYSDLPLHEFEEVRPFLDPMENPLSGIVDNGTTQIWYAKSSQWFLWEEVLPTVTHSSEHPLDSISRELVPLRGRLKRLTEEVTYEELRKTHAKLGHTRLTNLDEIYWTFQVETRFSEETQRKLRLVVQRLCLEHTAMSVGDIVLFPLKHKGYIVSSSGFFEFTFNPK